MTPFPLVTGVCRSEAKWVSIVCVLSKIMCCPKEMRRRATTP